MVFARTWLLAATVLPACSAFVPTVSRTHCPTSRCAPLALSSVTPPNNASSRTGKGSSPAPKDGASESGDGQGTSRSGATGNRGRYTAAAFGAAGVYAGVRRRAPLPVAMVHGILDRAESMEVSAEWVRRLLGKGSYVRCIEVGNGIVDSLSRPMEWQLKQLAAQIRSDPKLRDGLHLIGYSQGSLLARAFVQRYDWPKVHTLVSWVGPQAGQFGVPDLEPLLGYISQVTSAMWYTPPLQKSFSFANYWRDPHRLELYRAQSTFLADVNNEREVKNRSYAERIAALEHFVLIYSEADTVIQPALSSWFGFYRENSSLEMLPLSRSPLYLDDWIGLRSLDEAGRLHFASCNCIHTDVHLAKCKVEVWDRATKRYLARKRAVTSKDMY